MRALKASIVVMSVLIVAGLIVVGVTLYNRAVVGDTTTAKTDTTAEPARPFGTVDLNLPAGATVRQTTISGRRLVVTISIPESGQWIYVIRLDTGALLGKIRINAPAKLGATE